MEQLSYANQSLAAPGLHKVLIIDLENCPSQIHDLKNSLDQYPIVVICYAQSHARIPLDWLIPLNKVINEKRLRIYKMAESGKNSADFGIAFYSGMLIQECPADTQFTIVSNDSDMDHVVHLLRDQGRRAQRVGNSKRIPVNPTQVSEDFIKYCQFLQKYPKGRPVRKEGLRNSIKSQLKYDESSADKLVNQLSQRGILSINESKITYNASVIASFSNFPHNE